MFDARSVEAIIYAAISYLLVRSSFSQMSGEVVAVTLRIADDSIVGLHLEYYEYYWPELLVKEVSPHGAVACFNNMLDENDVRRLVAGDVIVEVNGKQLHTDMVDELMFASVLRVRFVHRYTPIVGVTLRVADHGTIGLSCCLSSHACMALEVVSVHTGGALACFNDQLDDNDPRRFECGDLIVQVNGENDPFHMSSLLFNSSNISLSLCKQRFKKRPSKATEIITMPDFFMAKPGPVEMPSTPEICYPPTPDLF